MTNIQVLYQQHLETKRSNLVKEAEARRHNRVTEVQTNLSQKETSRHNLATEGLSAGQLAETTRHNRAGESMAQLQFGESQRHNLATERLSSAQIAETTRSNKAKEDENVRHNMAYEAIQRGVAEESVRHNQVLESQSQSGLDTEKTKVFTTLEQAQQRLDSDIAYQEVARDKMRAETETEIAKERLTNSQRWKTNVSIPGELFSSIDSGISLFTRGRGFYATRK